VCAIAGIATDITPRVQMEAALQERERQLAEAQRVAHVGSFAWDAVTDRVSWSDELYRIYGLDPQSFGATFDAFVARVHPDDRPLVLDTIRQAMAAGGPFRMQERIVRPSGEVRHLSSWGEVVCDGQGRPVRLVGICQDVSEQRRQEEALRASEARFRRLVEANIIGVTVAEFGGAIMDANDAFLQMVGYTREEVAAGALHWDAMTPPAYRDRDEQAIRTLRAARTCPAYEKEYIGKDGRRVAVLVGAAVLEGAPDAFIAFVLDLTERKRVEDEVRHLNETLEQRVVERTAQLREANEQLEAFAYSVSHDLRAPLRAMQGFAVALLEDYADRLDADGQEYARRMDAAAARMDLLIADLLAYSRLSRAAIGVQPVALDAAMASALAQVEAELRQRQAQVHVTSELPRVMAHHATLVQVVANLLTNAAKFVAPNTRPEVAVWAEACGPWTRLWVADNGIGIAPEHRERIFGVFERLHGVETYPGTGIGLAIVRKGMERLGGRVGLESTVGRGSRFWIELPTVGEGTA
jgi:PAS domain S-box-containing protein